MAGASAPLGKLVELIGMTAARRLMEQFGGTEIYVPHASRVKPHGKLAQAIGFKSVKRLASMWPQSHVLVPRGRGVMRLTRRRDLAILEDHTTLTAPQLARKYEMTLRNVYSVLQRGREGLDDASPVAADSEIKERSHNHAKEGR